VFFFWPVSPPLVFPVFPPARASGCVFFSSFVLKARCFLRCRAPVRVSPDFGATPPLISPADRKRSLSVPVKLFFFFFFRLGFVVFVLFLLCLA